MPRTLPWWIVVAVALLFFGCPDAAPGPGDVAMKPADAAVELDAADDLSTDAGDAMDASDARPTDAAVDAVTVDADCVPGRVTPCVCFNGVAGTSTCHRNGRRGACTCVRGGTADGGTRALPPRLVAPLSGTRLTSQRPTLRWVPPTGVSRSRVQLCQDRACTHALRSEEVSGTSWRSATPLTPGVMFWHIEGLGSDGATIWTSATWSFKVRYRDTPVDSANVPLHDFDGDGHDDVVALVDDMNGILQVFLGNSSALAPLPTAELQSPDDRGGTYDWAVTVGDLNGDGLADLVVGEPLLWTFGGLFDYGHVHIYYGGEGGIRNDRTQLVRYEAEEMVTNWHETPYAFGYGVGIVDYDGDGFDDLLVLRKTRLATQPQLHLYTGSPRGVEENRHRDALAEISLDLLSNARGVGDVDGDGYGDFAVGIPDEHGDYGLALLHGNPDGILDRRVEQIDDRDNLYRFASTVYGGDFNGDGLADMVCGAYGRLGMVYGSLEGIEFGPLPSRPPFFDSRFGRTIFGTALDIQGDMNGDGIFDVVTTAICDEDDPMPGFPCLLGIVFLYPGSVAGTAPMWSRYLAASDYHDKDWSAANRAAVPGDLNADGIDDLLVGALGSRAPGTEAGAGPVGALHVYLGGRWDWTHPSSSVRTSRMGVFLAFKIY